MRAREKVVGRGSRWREECKGGLWWRPVESDEERAARGDERERGRAAATREVRGGSVGEDRKRKRETETDSVLDPPGIDAFVCQNAETPASFLPSFLLSSRGSSLPSPSYLTRSVVSLRLSPVFLSVSLSPCPSFPVPLSVAPSREFRPPCFHVVLLTLTLVPLV